MEKAKQLLEGNGLSLATQFREESFTPKPAKPRVLQAAAMGASSSRIRFVKSGKEVELAAGATILEAAEACGLYLPSSCRQGRCGTCRVTMISGAVAMPDQEALSPEDAAQGAVLACIGTPKGGSVEVDL
jgi:ferredoxin